MQHPSYQPGEHEALIRAVIGARSLSRTAVLTYFTLSTLETPCPSMAYLAECCQLKIDKARRAIRELESRGWITVEYRPNDPSVYTLRTPTRHIQVA